MGKQAEARAVVVIEPAKGGNLESEQVSSGDTDQGTWSDSREVLLQRARGIHQHRRGSQVKEGEQAAIEIDAHGDQDHDTVPLRESPLMKSPCEGLDLFAEGVEANLATARLHQGAALRPGKEVDQVGQVRAFSNKA
jgi:hypothetical protein